MFSTSSIATLVSLTVAQADAPASASPLVSNVALFGVLIMLFWFLLIAPERKKAQKHAELLDSLKKGDLVITSGGMHGEVVKTEKTTVTLRIAPKIDVVFEKDVIARKIVPEAPPSEKS